MDKAKLAAQIVAMVFQLHEFQLEKAFYRYVGMDSEIASRFTDEAEKHIPDYWNVIYLITSILKDNISKDAYIMDVGCANGNTLACLYAEGFQNLFGIDASSEMIARARERLKRSCSKCMVGVAFPFIRRMEYVDWT